MLKLRHARVLETRRAHDGHESEVHARSTVAVEQRLIVELTAGEAKGERREAIADTALVGHAEVGDELIVNVQALDLGLGSGGFDVVHVNLTRGLAERSGAAGPGDPHVMKLNYTSLQHAVAPVERGTLELPIGRPTAVLAVHGQLAALAWAFQ